MSVPVMATACGPRTQRRQCGRDVTAQQTTNGGKGWFGQGQVGCDYQFGLPLLLLEPQCRDRRLFRLRICRQRHCAAPWRFRAVVFGGENMPWTWAAGARAGFLVTPKFLTYFDGGYTQANFSRVNFQICLLCAPTRGFSVAANTYNGWFLGSGFEYGFDILPACSSRPSIAIRASIQRTCPSLSGGAATGNLINSTKYTQMISTELVYRFNWFNHY